MAKLTVEERLDVAINQYAKDAEAGQPSREIAEQFYETEPKLVEHFTREWVLEKLTALIRSHRAVLKAADDPQLLLGFTVPQKLTLKSGDKLPFRDATLWQIRRYRAMVWKDKRKHPQVEKLDKAIDLMKPYATEQRGITYSQVVELEAEKVKETAAK